MKKITIAIIIALVTLTGCGSVDTTSSVTAVRTGGGPLEDQAFKDCVPASTHQIFNSYGDKYYPYPLSERDYDATGQKGSDAESFTVVSKDNIQMRVPVIIRFNMVSDCDSLKAFHKAHGERYRAFLAEDGQSTEGWLVMLRKLMGDPVDAELDEVAKSYNGIDLYNKAEAQNDLQSSVTDNIEEIVSTQAKGDYFENFVVLVKKPEPVDPAFLATLNTAQQELAKSQAAVAKAQADVAKANAEVKVAEAEAAKRKAEIAGFGSVDEYNKANLIDKGGNPYQPQYIYPGQGQP